MSAKSHLEDLEDFFRLYQKLSLELRVLEDRSGSKHSEDSETSNHDSEKRDDDPKTSQGHDRRGTTENNDPQPLRDSWEGYRR